MFAETKDEPAVLDSECPGHFCPRWSVVSVFDHYRRLNLAAHSQLNWLKLECSDAESLGTISRPVVIVVADCGEGMRASMCEALEQEDIRIAAFRRKVDLFVLYHHESIGQNLERLDFLNDYLSSNEIAPEQIEHYFSSFIVLIHPTDGPVLVENRDLTVKYVRQYLEIGKWDR